MNSSINLWKNCSAILFWRRQLRKFCYLERLQTLYDSKSIHCRLPWQLCAWRLLQVQFNLWKLKKGERATLLTAGAIVMSCHKDKFYLTHGKYTVLPQIPQVQNSTRQIPHAKFHTRKIPQRKIPHRQIPQRKIPHTKISDLYFWVFWMYLKSKTVTIKNVTIV